MISAQELQSLAPQVRQAMLALMEQVAQRDEQLRTKDTLIEQREREAAFKQALIDKLTHEVAVLRRLKYAATSEKFTGTAEQKSLLQDTLEADLAELGQEMKRLGVDVDAADEKTGKKQPKREKLPPHRIRPAKSSCDSEMAQGCSCPRHFIADTWTLQESSCRAGGHGGGMRRSSGIRLCGRAGSPACRSQPLHWPMVSTRTWFASG